MKPRKLVAAYGAALVFLALLALVFHWSWEQSASTLCVFVVLVALNFGRPKLVKVLTPKHLLAAKIGPELVVVALAIWAIGAKICGNRGSLWLEICTAVIFLSVVFTVLNHFRDRLALEQPGE